MSLWGRLTEMAEKANDAIVDNIAPLLDDSDEEYYSTARKEVLAKMKTQMVWWKTQVAMTLAHKIIKTLLMTKVYAWKPSSTCRGLSCSSKVSWRGTYFKTS